MQPNTSSKWAPELCLSVRILLFLCYDEVKTPITIHLKKVNVEENIPSICVLTNFSLQFISFFVEWPKYQVTLVPNIFFKSVIVNEIQILKSWWSHQVGWLCTHIVFRSTPNLLCKFLFLSKGRKRALVRPNAKRIMKSY